MKLKALKDTSGKMIKKISEVQLGKPIISWLQEMGWEVYQEVQIATYDSVADIVAKQGKLIWVIAMPGKCTTDTNGIRQFAWPKRN